MSKAGRIELVVEQDARKIWNNFLTDWTSIAQIDVSEFLVATASSLSWDYGLRDYDAVHMATALLWKDALAEPVTLSTFNR